MKIVCRVPKESILGPLLISIFLADLFFIVNSSGYCQLCRRQYTPKATANGIDSFLASLEEASKPLFTWFDNNLMKRNADKCHILLSSNKKK